MVRGPETLRESAFCLIWSFGTVSSPKFEPVTYSWSPAEETRKLKGHSVVSPNALCYYSIPGVGWDDSWN